MGSIWKRLKRIGQSLEENDSIGPLESQKGFSLMEVMVAGSLMVGVGVGVTQLMQVQSK